MLQDANIQEARQIFPVRIENGRRISDWNSTRQRSILTSPKQAYIEDRDVSIGILPQISTTQEFRTSRISSIQSATRFECLLSFFAYLSDSNYQPQSLGLHRPQPPFSQLPIGKKPFSSLGIHALANPHFTENISRLQNMFISTKMYSKPAINVLRQSKWP